MPTLIIPDKICPHCGGAEWYINTRVDKRVNRIYNIVLCAVKYRLRGKQNRIKRREAHKIYSKAYYEKNKDFLKSCMKITNKLYKQKPENKVKINTDQRKRYRLPENQIKRKEKYKYNWENLTPVAVNSLLINAFKQKVPNIKVADLTSELVETYRKKTLLKRKLKQLQNENKNQTHI